MDEEKSADDSDEVKLMFETYQQRIKQFEDTVCEFPVEANNIMSDQWKPHREESLGHMKSCYPLLHGGVISLAHDFLSIKREYGSSIERELYENMTLVGFFDRLATKRCVVFFQSYDSYLLRNGYNDNGRWDTIGTADENEVTKYDVDAARKPKLAEYLSYDEIMINAMCGISSRTHFINNGDRRNCGKPEEDGYPVEGIYMGLVGARFEKSSVMEHALMAVTVQQNTQDNGYGSPVAEHEENKDDGGDPGPLSLIKELDPKLFMQRVALSAKRPGSKPIFRAFEKFYDRPHLPLFEEARQQWKAENEDPESPQTSRYCQKMKWDKAPFLDKSMFKTRIRVSMELFLFDADRRAAECKKTAFCHVVGLGTGVWSFNKRVQDSAIAQVTKEIIEETILPNIAAVYFSWMKEDSESVFEADKETASSLLVRDFEGHSISVLTGKRAPADELEEPFKDCLLTAMYAWDGNSFPGNEYYHGMLSASGDPAAASCSTISFVQNSEINKEHINGESTGVYFYDRSTHRYEFVRLGLMKFEDNKAKWLKKSMQSVPYKRDRFVQPKKQKAPPKIDPNKFVD